MYSAFSTSAQVNYIPCLISGSIHTLYLLTLKMFIFAPYGDKGA